ncbi:mechanosensitive ion channel protein MscS [Janibacter sp. Soil728]|uniref:mechanosensitive ion channel family protein n=1 Tax=Janibacter sp. Soil728 TaxID=1736393 RepID=UPI0007023911|nr:mechanosensitive ion channel family protein [Janibacter sp. Soil728]KRE38101.1 mechanosensitive ion channel protein MscS [Janibacter sp. Soil728]
MTSFLNQLGAAAVDLTWESAADWLLGAPLKILVTIVLAVVARWLAHRAITKAVEASIARSEASREKRDHKRVQGKPSLVASERYRQRTLTMGSLLRSIATIVIATVSTLTVLALLGIPLAPLLASAGVGGVALGFGAQALVRDYLSGIFMILEDQYGVGDFIDTGEAVGTVEEVTLRVTRLRDLDGVVWYVRNGEIIRIGNRSQGWSTVMVDLPFSYKEDVDRVIGIITAAVSRMKDDGHWSEVLRETPSVLGVETITAGTVTVRVFATCTPNENWGIQREIRRRVKEAFDREGIAGPPLAVGGTGQHQI